MIECQQGQLLVAGQAHVSRMHSLYRCLSVTWVELDVLSCVMALPTPNPL